MKKIVLLISVSILLFSCNEEVPIANVSVSGKISNISEGAKIYLDYLTPNQLISKDSTIIDGNGNYQFSYKIDNLGYYRLRINNQNFVNLVLNIGEKPIINGDGNNLMDTYTIIGSDESNRLKDFQLAYKINSWRQDSLGRIYQANPNDAKLFIDLQKARFNIINQMNANLTKIVNKNLASLVSLQAVQQLDPESNSKLYKKVDEALWKTLSDNPWVVEFHKKVEKLIKISVGESAPDITLNDVNGNSLSLSSLEGKVVLIDFWASWCKPCRAENPNVVKAYHKYNKKGFEVFSVSLDGMPQQQNAKQNWIDAIQKDGLIWKTHVSDLSGWKSSVVPLYGIQSIPFTVLIDRDGKIIGKNVRGEALENKLAQIFE